MGRGVGCSGAEHSGTACEWMLQKHRLGFKQVVCGGGSDIHPKSADASFQRLQYFWAMRRSQQNLAAHLHCQFDVRQDHRGHLWVWRSWHRLFIRRKQWYLNYVTTCRFDDFFMCASIFTASRKDTCSIHQIKWALVRVTLSRYGTWAYIHLFIHYLYCSSCEGLPAAGEDPSCHWARSQVLPRQVASQSQTHRKRQPVPFTNTYWQLREQPINLESQLNLWAWLWTVRGSPSGRTKPVRAQR